MVERDLKAVDESPPEEGGWDDEITDSFRNEGAGAGTHPTLRPCLVLMSGRQIGQVVHLDPFRPLRIGRARDADLTVYDSTLSRYHAEVYVNADGHWCFRDLGSTNGSSVNREPVTEAVLGAHDLIEMGGGTVLKFEYHGPVENDFHKRLYEAGTQDPMLGVFNRRYFEQHFLADFRLAHRHQTPLSILMMDIDRFKSINDTYGHAAGDSVLCSIAAVLRERIRAEDILARFGGEEFVMLLRQTDEEGAVALAQSLRELVAGLSPKVGGKAIDVTVTTGIATMKMPHREFKDADAMIQAADVALYRGKEAGRNCVIVAEFDTNPAAAAVGVTRRFERLRRK